MIKKIASHWKSVLKSIFWHKHNFFCFKTFIFEIHFRPKKKHVVSSFVSKKKQKIQEKIEEMNPVFLWGVLFFKFLFFFRMNQEVHFFEFYFLGNVTFFEKFDIFKNQNCLRFQISIFKIFLQFFLTSIKFLKKFIF